MDSVPAGRVARKHVNGWMTVLALGLLLLGLLACLYVLIGFPAEAQAVGDSIGTPIPVAPAYPADPAPAPAELRRTGESSGAGRANLSGPCRYAPR